jgi:predicted DCC family thiol-disulfide oxidoreductase YuxK
MKQKEPLQVIYDGHCAICRASMEKIHKMFGEQVREVDFRIVPPQEIHPELTEARCKAKMHVLKDGRVYGGAEAMVQILRLHRLWRLIVPLYYVPPFGWLAERAYAFVAHNRFRLSRWLGKGVPECADACSIQKKD